MTFGGAVKLHIGKGADAKGRNSKESYVQHEGQLSGLIKLVLMWHAIGHPVSLDNLPNPSLLICSSA
jgi:hypothetical protein